MTYRAALRVVLLWLALVSPLGAQRAIDWSSKPVFLMTMGQGDAVFEKFGHNALVVWDDVMGQPLVYNWGMFDFAQPNFIGRFLSGDTKYWMEPRTLEGTLAQYRQLNRTVTLQELRLTPSQKQALVQRLATNALEENKFYRYDYYRDNCSTRVRDALDAVTGGALARVMQPAAGQGSYRWHTRRLLAYSTPLYLGSELVLGVDADTPLTSWEQAFLPLSLSESVTRIELPAAENLPARMLAAPVDTVFRAAREAEPTAVAPRIAVAALVGIVLGAVLLLVSRLGKVGASIAIGAWSLASVLVGTVLLLAWFATEHHFMGNNPSVSLLNPAWMVGVVAAVMVLRNGVSWRVRSLLKWLLAVAALGSLAAVILGHGVSALELAALVLPGHAVVVYAADRFRRGDPATLPR
ncbi:MAG: DUF4105 domain-containing protein [Gemmatimonadota bacterium]